MKGKCMKQSIGKQAVILLAIVTLCVGCASVRATTKPYSSGRILLLPPRDVVQNGLPHSKGEGSGSFIQNHLMNSFSGTAFELLTTDSNEFSHKEIATKEKGLEEARRLNADYCLQIVLGEFLNAAPMTFRSDYVHMEKSIMYDVRTGETVWQLVRPLRFEKTNLGNHLVLLESFASTISSSIQSNMK